MTKRLAHGAESMVRDAQFHPPITDHARRWGCNRVKDHRVQGPVLLAFVLSALLLGCESNDAEKQTLAVYGTVHPRHIFDDGQITPRQLAQHPHARLAVVDRF